MNPIIHHNINAVENVNIVTCNSNNQEKEIKIFKSAWPAIKLANNRKLKLKIREKQDISSIKTKKGAIVFEVFKGKNRFAYFHFVLIIVKIFQ